jgi:hypothetical protein
MPVGLSGQRQWPPMIWVGGAQGAGKTTVSWRLSRAHDLPLHPVDLWSYDHQARLPAGDSLDDQLDRGAEAAADAFESVSQLRLELVLDDLLARELGAVPALVEGPQLMPGFAGELPPGGVCGSCPIRAARALLGRNGWPRPNPFGCECGTSGCRATWTATPDDYAARTASDRPLNAHYP